MPIKKETLTAAVKNRSQALLRLTKVHVWAVPCPRCCIPRFRNGDGSIRKPCLGDHNHPERLVLARKVSAILRHHFKVSERPCNGEAHANPHIDHCMVCMPNWGRIEYLAPRAELLIPVA